MKQLADIGQTLEALKGYFERLGCLG
jgi:hypothetical protein